MDEAKYIAGIFGFAGFTVALLAGAASGTDMVTAMSRGLVALCACAVVGVFAGLAVRHVVKEHVAATKLVPGPEPVVRESEEIIDVEPVAE